LPKYKVSIDKPALNRYFFTVEASSEEALEDEIGKLLERGGVPDKVVHDIQSSEGYIEYLELEDYNKMDEEDKFTPDTEAHSPTFIQEIEPHISLHRCLNTGVCYVGDIKEGNRYIPFATAQDPKIAEGWLPEDIVLYSKSLRTWLNISLIDPGVPYFDLMLQHNTCLQADKVIQAHLDREKENEPK
jgi:hypothetical protein